MLNYYDVSVKGKNPKTGRQKTTFARIPITVAKAEIPNHPEYLNELEPPYEITVIEQRPPTEQQINYARDLGLDIPKNAILEDVSGLLDRRLGGGVPNPDLMTFARNHDLLFSDCISKKGLYNLIFTTLPLLDQIAFFCFSVYRYLSNDRHANLDSSPHHDLFYSFAAEQVTNTKFIDSLDRYEGEDVRFFGRLRIKREDSSVTTVTGGDTNTYAYRTVRAFLEQHFTLEKGNTRTIDESKLNSSKQAKSGGCGCIVLLAPLLLGGIWYFYI